MPETSGTAWRIPAGRGPLDDILPHSGVTAAGWVLVEEQRGEVRQGVLHNVTTGARMTVGVIPGDAYLFGEADDRFIAIKQTASAERWQEFRLSVFDGETGRIAFVGTQGPARGGVFAPTPIEAFGIRSGRLWWLRGMTQTKTEVFVVDPVTGKSSRVAAGPYVGAFFHREGLALQRLEASASGWRDFVDLKGSPLALTDELTTVAQRQWVAAGPNGSLVWLNDGWTELYYVPGESGAESLIWQGTSAGAAQNLPMMGQTGFTLVTMDEKAYWFDLRQGTIRKLSDSQFADISADRVLVLRDSDTGGPRPGRKGHRIIGFHLLDMAALPREDCRKTPGALTPTTAGNITPTIETPVL